MANDGKFVGEIPHSDVALTRRVVGIHSAPDMHVDLAQYLENGNASITSRSTSYDFEMEPVCDREISYVTIDTVATKGSGTSSTSSIPRQSRERVNIHDALSEREHILLYPNPSICFFEGPAHFRPCVLEQFRRNLKGQRGPPVVFDSYPEPSQHHERVRVVGYTEIGTRYSYFLITTTPRNNRLIAVGDTLECFSALEGLWKVMGTSKPDFWWSYLELYNAAEHTTAVVRIKECHVAGTISIPVLLTTMIREETMKLKAYLACSRNIEEIE